MENIALVPVLEDWQRTIIVHIQTLLMRQKLVLLQSTSWLARLVGNRMVHGVRKRRLTMRAAEGGYAARLLAVFWLCAYAVSTGRPPSHPKRVTCVVGQHQ
jgi:hypothetical protein